jgi:hypothetical protein
MGFGSYSYSSASSRASTTYSHVSREEIFKQRHLDPDMDPKGVKYRESCDRDGEESFPIIIALDETGSMGHMPELLIKNVFPKIMKTIMEAGIPNPQVMFAGIGDCCYNEEAALQVGEFESNDALMEKWLTNIYLEGRGGGNAHESYPLIWYFAAHHIKTDAYDKRGQKGVLITIGDEPCQQLLTKKQIKKYIGDDVQDDITAKELLEQVKTKFNVYHIHCDGSRTYDFTDTNWEDLLGINAVVSKSSKGTDVGDIIPKLVELSYNNR